jgi:hypothetical protein
MLGTQRNCLPTKIEARNSLEKLSVPEIFVARKEMLGDLDDDFNADANLASRPNLYSRYQKAF